MASFLDFKIHIISIGENHQHIDIGNNLSWNSTNQPGYREFWLSSLMQRFDNQIFFRHQKLYSRPKDFTTVKLWVLHNIEPVLQACFFAVFEIMEKNESIWFFFDY